jgi:hypothetical protein
MFGFRRVVIHHQGAGRPNDNFAYADGGYSYGVGINLWRNFREPRLDWSTIDFNHVVVGVCLSGNREDYVVTQKDMQLLREISFDAKSKGWLVDIPEVIPHRESPGSNTVCPGMNAAPPWGPYPGDRQAWDQIRACFQGHNVPVPGDDDMPADKDFVDALTTGEGSWKLQYDGGVQTIAGPFYGSYFSLPQNVQNDPSRRFLSIIPNVGAPGYALVSVKGEVYNFKTKQ